MEPSSSCVRVTLSVMRWILNNYGAGSASGEAWCADGVPGLAKQVRHGAGQEPGQEEADGGPNLLSSAGQDWQDWTQDCEG